MKMKTILFFLLLISSILFVRLYYFNSILKVKGTLLNLRYAKGLINEYHINKGKYPETLEEIKKIWCQNRGEDTPLKEFISNSNNSQKEHRELNGKGGWYYNPETGEIRVNLTRPLKEYFLFYFRDNKDAIPSTWE